MAVTRSTIAKQKADRIVTRSVPAKLKADKRVTRSMIAKQKAGKTASNKSKSGQPMTASNKSKSGKHKKIATKTTTTRDETCYERKWRLIDDAYVVFMMDWKFKNQDRIDPTWEFIPLEFQRSVIGREWKEMDDKGKAVYLKRVRKMKSEGFSSFDCNCFTESSPWWKDM